MSKWNARAGGDPHNQSVLSEETTGKTLAVFYNDTGGRLARRCAALPELIEAVEEVLKIWHDLYSGQADAEERLAWRRLERALDTAKNGGVQRCNHCMTVFDEEETVCPECGRDDALMYPFEPDETDHKEQNWEVTK